MTKTEHIGFRAPADSRDAWQQAAEREGMSLSAWIVAACDNKISAARMSGNAWLRTSRVRNARRSASGKIYQREAGE